MEALENNGQTLVKETKKCACCGEIKPISEFSINRKAKDGHQSYCKPCHRMKNKEIRDYKSDHGSDTLNPEKGFYAYPELVKFKPYQLINELKARGYYGEIHYKQTIKF